MSEARRPEQRVGTVFMLEAVSVPKAPEGRRTPRRWRETEHALQSRERSECGGFSTAFNRARIFVCLLDCRADESGGERAALQTLRAMRGVPENVPATWTACPDISGPLLSTNGYQNKTAQTRLIGLRVPAAFGSRLLSDFADSDFGFRVKRVTTLVCMILTLIACLMPSLALAQRPPRNFSMPPDMSRRVIGFRQLFHVEIRFRRQGQRPVDPLRAIVQRHVHQSGWRHQFHRSNPVKLSGREH